MAITTSYPKGMERLLQGSINFATDTIKVALVTDAYTYSAAHEFVSQLGTRVGDDVTLVNKSITGGAFDADDAETAPLVPGSTIKAIVIYKDTGNPSTSPLLLYRDNVTGFPLATNGGAVKLPWDNGPLKIAALLEPFFPAGGELVLGAGVNFLTDDLKVTLLPASFDSSGTYRFLADVGTTLGTAQALTGRTITGGVFNADDVEFGAVPGGSPGSVLLYKDTGVPETSPVLQRITQVAGFPFAANGGAFTLRWSDGALKIFSLIP